MNFEHFHSLFFFFFFFFFFLRYPFRPFAIDKYSAKNNADPIMFEVCIPHHGAIKTDQPPGSVPVKKVKLTLLLFFFFLTNHLFFF